MLLAWSSERDRSYSEGMGKLVLMLVGGFIAIMLLFWVIAKLVALLWIAIIVLVGFALLRLAFSAGRRSRSNR